MNSNRGIKAESPGPGVASSSIVVLPENLRTSLASIVAVCVLTREAIRADG
jgi:hypothetical protein